MAQQTAAGAHGAGLVAILEGVGGQQVGDDGVVVAGVQGDLVISEGDGTGHVDGQVAVEGSALDGLHALDGADLLPVVVGEDAAAHGHLQIEAHHVDDLSHLTGTVDQLFLGQVSQAAGADQSSIIAQGLDDLGLGHSLRSLAAHAGHGAQGAAGTGSVSVHFGLGDLQHALEQVDLGITDGELGGMHGNSQAVHAGFQVITDQAALAGLVELTVFIQHQGHGGQESALHQQLLGFSHG